MGEERETHGHDPGGDGDHGRPNPVSHDSLGPKAIENLGVEEARRQPTAADAVAALLTQQGRSTDPEVLVPGVRTRELRVAGAKGPDALAATLYVPEGRGPLPAGERLRASLFR